MKIEWASHFREDGTRRRPPPSTMHGWLAKMRGTLSGNENLRSKGMREMREARNRKRDGSKRKQLQKPRTGTGVFSFLGLGKKNKKKEGAKLQSSRRSGGSTRPSHHSTTSRAVRPPLRPSGTSHRSGHRSTRTQAAARPQQLQQSRRSTRR